MEGEENVRSVHPKGSGVFREYFCCFLNLFSGFLFSSFSLFIFCVSVGGGKKTGRRSGAGWLVDERESSFEWTERQPRSGKVNLPPLRLLNGK